MKKLNDIAEGFANDVSGGKVPVGNWKFTYHSKGNGKWFANSVKDEPGVTIHHQSDDRAVIEAPAHVHSRLVHSARNLRKDGRVTDKNDVSESLAEAAERLKAMIQVPEKPMRKEKKKEKETVEEAKGIDAGLQAKERRERVARDGDDEERMTQVRNLQQQIFHKVMENAGLQGTTELANKYAEDTPGQEPVAEAKATYCGRCGTTHVKPSEGGTCPALKKNK